MGDDIEQQIRAAWLKAIAADRPRFFKDLADYWDSDRPPQMTPETPATAIHDGREVTTIAARLRIGDAPPFFEVLSARKGREIPETIDQGELGERYIILTLPSLDTPVCHEEAKRFGELAGEVPEYRILVVSMDLPYAQHRWISEHESPLIAGSDHRLGAFGIKYGVLMQEPRLLMRAVFVVRDGRLDHAAYVQNSAHQVDFTAAIKAARS